MEKILLIMIATMTLSTATAQKMSITYQQSLHIDFLKALDDSDTSDMADDDIDEEDDELSDFDEKLKTAMKAKLEAQKDNTYKYIIGSEKIRYIRPDLRPGILFDEEFILLDREKRVMDHYTYSDKDGGQLMTFDLDRTKLRDIEVTYNIDTLQSDRKEILGYDCYRVIILKTIQDTEYGEEILQYDCYVTEEIDLPLHLLNTTLKPVLNACPLEMKTYHMSSGSTYSTYMAIDVNESEDAIIDVPDRFNNQ